MEFINFLKFIPASRDDFRDLIHELREEFRTEMDARENFRASHTTSQSPASANTPLHTLPPFPVHSTRRTGNPKRRTAVALQLAVCIPLQRLFS
jgi:hypothetical protein